MDDTNGRDEAASAEAADTADAGNALTERMMVMLELAYHSHTNGEIGALLGVSGHAVKNRLALIYKRVGLNQRPGPGGRVAALCWWHDERRAQRRVVARVAILLADHPLVHPAQEAS
jgi:DNA-binding NarL/FixJ family response regulator